MSEECRTLSLHAHGQALLETAVGAAFPLGGVHGTALSLCTGVTLVVLHRTLEETLQIERERREERDREPDREGEERDRDQEKN